MVIPTRLVIAWLCIACATAAAGPLREPSEVRKDIDACRRRIDDLRVQGAYIDQLAADARANKVLFVENKYPMSPEALTHSIAILALRGDDLARSAMADMPKYLADQRQRTLQGLDDIAKALAVDRERTSSRCGSLAAELKEAERPAPPRPDTGVLMTITLESAMQTRNLKTGVTSSTPHSPATTVSLASGTAYNGAVTTSAPVPDGYTIYVFYHSQIWAALGPTGGAFTVRENPGFAGQGVVEAHACRAGGTVGGQLTPPCLGGAGTVIDIQWRQ